MGLCVGARSGNRFGSTAPASFSGTITRCPRRFRAGHDQPGKHAVATDQVIESFRNEPWPGYKTGQGMGPNLLAQFPLARPHARDCRCVVVWSMAEFETDDAPAAGVTLDETGVLPKFGVPLKSIPDYLALVGDAADGYPGISGRVAKSTAAVLAKFGNI